MELTTFAQILANASGKSVAEESARIIIAAVNGGLEAKAIYALEELQIIGEELNK